MTVILTVCGVLPVFPVQIHEHRESVRKERKTWQFERDALQEELARLRGVVASKVKLNPQNPKDSLETSMQKAAEDTQLLRSVVVPLEEVSVWGMEGRPGKKAVCTPPCL